MIAGAEDFEDGLHESETEALGLIFDVEFPESCLLLVKRVPACGVLRSFEAHLAGNWNSLHHMEEVVSSFHP